MFQNYLKIAWRNLVKNRLYSLINIAGLALGMAVVMLIAFWMYDELSYNKSLGNYDRTVQLLHNWDDKVNNEVITEKVMPVPLAQELRTKYPAQFAQVALVKNTGSHVFAFAEKKISYP
ncbi:MAG: ABC transporter permease, partial [Mucilaginibacter polytrichastri]|nr:ABC transporter permease [Mucilaginibacter polytrichastri]